MAIPRNVLAFIPSLLLGCLVLASAPASAQQGFALDEKIPLGAINGRIDHLAIDIARRRLFVAELGNGSMSVVDLKGNKVIQRVTGLKEPQGVSYEPSADRIYVASGGDGLVTVLAGSDLSVVERIQLGDDADNIRLDGTANKVVVGYGSGALAVLDSKTHAKIAAIPLKAHPEGFQINPSTNRIYVNVPRAHEIAVVDFAAGKQIDSWKLPSPGANFPMALDPDAGTVTVALRNPGRLLVLNEENGGSFGDVEICNDADDVHWDSKRQRFYVSCGDGFLDVIELSEGTYFNVGHVPTAVGARTSLFVAELDRLFLAVRATQKNPAAIWVFRPIR